MPKFSYDKTWIGYENIQTRAFDTNRFETSFKLESLTIHLTVRGLDVVRMLYNTDFKEIYIENDQDIYEIKINQNNDFEIFFSYSICGNPYTDCSFSEFIIKRIDLENYIKDLAERFPA